MRATQSSTSCVISKARQKSKNTLHLLAQHLHQANEPAILLVNRRKEHSSYLSHTKALRNNGALIIATSLTIIFGWIIQDRSVASQKNFTHHAIDTVVFLSISDDVDNTKEDEHPQTNDQSNLFTDLLLLLLQLLRCNYSIYIPCFISSLVITATHS